MRGIPGRIDGVMVIESRRRFTINLLTDRTGEEPLRLLVVGAENPDDDGVYLFTIEPVADDA